MFLIVVLNINVIGKIFWFAVFASLEWIFETIQKLYTTVKLVVQLPSEDSKDVTLYDVLYVPELKCSSYKNDILLMKDGQ